VKNRHKPRKGHEENSMDKEERIRQLRAGIQAELDRTADKDEFNSNPQRRMELEIELLEQGCQVDQDEHGLLVNRKFIVAVSKSKWCVKGKYVWYYYKDIPTFVKKYVRREHDTR
jgi:hypothetical protein